MKPFYFMISICLFMAPLNAYSDFRAGVGMRVVTPDPLLPVSGGVGPSEPADTQRGDLTVRALVLEDEDTRVAMVSTDFLGFPSALGDRVREQIDAIPPDNILIGATHTHSGPDMYGFPNEEGEFTINEDYVNWVCGQAVLAIQDAVDSLEPASVKIASGVAKGKIAFNYYAPQLYDPRCAVLQCVDANGNTIATVVNYAVHPEVLGADQGILSPDLVGPLYDRIEEQEGGTALFMNSALGGMVTADVRGPDGEHIRTWEECVRIGHQLADEAMRIVRGADVQEDPDVFCAANPVTFPITSEEILMIVQNSPLDYDINADQSITTQVNVVNVGSAQMLTIPGEALPNIGYYLKRNMHGRHNFLLGLTNDAFGYILSKVDYNSFERYDYISHTSLGEKTGEIFMERALEFVNRCPRPSQGSNK